MRWLSGLGSTGRNDLDLDKFRDHLNWAEGREPFPYKDTVGKISIGVGRNLDDVGLSEDEINYLLENDIRRAVTLASGMPYWDSLSSRRKLVVADMVFNLGLAGFKTFVLANAAMARGDWDEAAEEMVRSKWFTQTGRRARKLVEMMRLG